MSRHLLIRADADAKIGTGHVMRCLALAQAWQDDGGTVSFATRELPEGLKQRLRSEQIEVIPLAAGTEAEDASNLVSLAKGRAECVVVDGYAFGIAHQRALREAGVRQLFIDDYGHSQEYVADFVLNQNITADESLYCNRAPHTKLLLGTKYALLRREFRVLKGWTRELAPKATKVMVTMGGSDPDNVTSFVLRSLDQLRRPELRIRVVLGYSNPHREELEAYRFTSMPGPEILLTPTMPELMRWADIAITATGTTCLELLFMQLPFVGLAISDNQRPISEKLQADELAEVFRWRESIPSDSFLTSLEKLLDFPKVRQLFADRGHKLVDGCGASSVVRQLLGLRFELYAATESDCRIIWEWANEPQTRAVSFNSNVIPWEEHVAWFRSQLQDARTRFWLARDHDGVPIGQVRFFIEGSEATISIGLDARQRGKGYGAALIRTASDRLCQESVVKTIHAYIKPDNKSSIRAFENAGYRAAATTEIQGHAALHYVLERASL